MNFKKREVPNGNGNGDLFLKFHDGESKVGLLRGEPYEFYQVWEGGRSRVVAPDNASGKSRFRVNFVQREGDKFVARIWEFGLKVYNQLAELHTEYDLSETKIKITRIGEGTKTVYMVMPIAKEPIPKSAMKEIQALPLNALNNHGEAKKDKQEPNDIEHDDEVPF